MRRTWPIVRAGMAIAALAAGCSGPQGSGGDRESTTAQSKGGRGVFEAIETGGDSTRLYVTGDLRPGAPGVVVFHAWWGLNGDVIAYADRLAAAGFAVVAPDLYRGALATTVDEAESLARSLDEASADSIALATVDRLTARLGPESKLGAVGFSLGAAWAMWTPLRRDRVVASVVYYGTTGGPVLEKGTASVIGHFAETDPFEPDASVEAFERALQSARRDVVVYRYPGTGHWFAEPSRDAWREAPANLAFERTVSFLRERLRSL